MHRGKYFGKRQNRQRRKKLSESIKWRIWHLEAEKEKHQISVLSVATFYIIIIIIIILISLRRQLQSKKG